MRVSTNFLNQLVASQARVRKRWSWLVSSRILTAIHSLCLTQLFPTHSRRKVLAGERLIGCWCSLANPISTEILGIAGFDWLLFDAEHSPNDVLTLIPQLMALKDSPSAPVVRPPANDAVILKRLLDAGFYNFLIPFVESAQEAQRAVAATRYPPAGIRGVSVAQRSNRYGTVPDYFASVND